MGFWAFADNHPMALFGWPEAAEAINKWMKEAP